MLLADIGGHAATIAAVTAALVGVVATYEKVLKPLALWCWRLVRRGLGIDTLADADHAADQRLTRIEDKVDRLADTVGGLDERLRSHLDEEDLDLAERRAWRSEIEAKVASIEACVTNR